MGNRIAHHRDTSTGMTSYARHGLVHFFDTVTRAPTICDQHFLSRLIDEEVHSVVDRLLLGNTHTPRNKAGGDVPQESIALLSVLFEDQLLLLQLLTQVVEQSETLVVLLGYIVYVRSIALTELADTLVQFTTLHKNREGVLVLKNASERVDNPLGDLSVAEEHVAMRHLPEKVLETIHLLTLLDHTGDHAKCTGVRILQQRRVHVHTNLALKKLLVVTKHMDALDGLVNGALQALVADIHLHGITFQINEFLLQCRQSGQAIGCLELGFHLTIIGRAHMRHLKFDLLIVALLFQKSEFTFHVIEAFHLCNKVTLQRVHIRIEILELKNTQMTERIDRIVCNIVTDDELEQLHVFRAEETRSLHR
mmetsp:Transcript_23793/g.59538  ORF Transcript_23793/g.59538 Transcript_23793/m.59538 type:complete len:365 (+) Transcript_23793:1458-2552(+)